MIMFSPVTGEPVLGSKVGDAGDPIEKKLLDKRT